jgi:large subunit ribosomal protein L25
VVDYVIEAQPRTITGKEVKQLRNQGLVPAVVYGPKIDPVHVQIPYRPLEITLMHAGGTNLIDLKIGKDTHTVLTRDVQRHVLKGSIMHVDFVAVDLTQNIIADIFIHFVGESPAVAAGLGMLLTGPSSLSVETLPANLPEHIEVDLSGLVDLGSAIHVHDLQLGEGIKIVNDPDEMIARVVQPSAARAAEDELGEAAASEEVPVIGQEEDREDED